VTSSRQHKEMAMTAQRSRHRPRPLLGLIATGLALSACGAGHVTALNASGHASPRAPGTAGATSSPHSAVDAQHATRPSASSLMICSTETRHNLATLLGASRPPLASSSWANRVYTCTYHLSRGPLVLTVQEAGTPAAGRRYYNALRARLGPSQPLTGAQGLGLPAFETNNGAAVFLKDDKTLQVDASRLPRSVGGAHRSRSDLAYTLATDIMGCWAGD
jgi:hypothetical protein